MVKGEQIRRKPSERERNLLLDNYDRPWHLQLQLNVEQQLERWGHFLRRGYTVSIQFPYAGCLVPDRYLGDARVPAIMIEINRYLGSLPRD